MRQSRPKEKPKCSAIFQEQANFFGFPAPPAGADEAPDDVVMRAPSVHGDGDVRMEAMSEGGPAKRQGGGGDYQEPRAKFGALLRL